MGTQPTARIEALFHEIVDLTPARRSALLQARCGADPDLLRQLESLVHAYDHVSTIFGRLNAADSEAPLHSASSHTSAPPTHRRYRIVREIGRGGMGVVYLGTDLQLDRAVALKFLHAASATDAPARTRLLAEARAAAMLDHPNVATIYEVGQSDDGRLFIAMAYCPGESLRARLERGPLPTADAVRLARQVADALAAAHNRGLVHRDIKPANLLFSAPDHVKVVDFGIAARGDPTRTVSIEIAGTVAYMSPEQAVGAPVDARTDVWSLGIVLFEMLTCRRPFDGTSWLGLVNAILHDPPERLPPGVRGSAELQAVLDRALAKDPADRYSTAAAMALDLQRLTAPGELQALTALPTYLTSFVGRQRELAAAREAVLTARLVTLTGPPGTGKTRLATRLATDLGDHFPDGQVLVPLAAISDPELVPAAIAKALGLRVTGGQASVDAIRQHVADRRLLLILDNFEQLLHAGTLVITLVSACRHLTVLVTSRASLHLAGEREFTVPPLDCPPADALDEVAGSDAVTLFEERARCIQPGFSVYEQNAPAVAEICRRLDGLPLAIELAAARIRILPPKAILTRLGNRLDLLKGGARDAPSRHQTLRQAIAWSYELLTSAEKPLLRRLAVFAGGFTLDAAEHVSADVPGLAPLEGLTALVENNLVTSRPGREGEPRFGMLETIREFSLECLRGAGEETEVRRAHSEYFASLVQNAAGELTGSRQGEHLDTLAEEHDNLRGAVEWMLAAGHGDHAAALAAGLWRFWLVRGHLREGADVITRVLAATSDVSARRLTLLSAAGTLAHNLGDYPSARSSHERAVEMARALGDERAVAGTLNDVGWVAWRQGDYTVARSLSLESLALHRELGNNRGIAIALNNLGWIAHHEGAYPAAEEFHRQALALRESIGDTRLIGFSLVNLAWALVRQERFEEAQQLVQRARTLLEAVGERQLIAFAGVIAAEGHRGTGDNAAALALADQSTRTFQKIGDQYGIAATLAVSAMAAQHLGDRATALARAGDSLRLRREIGDRWGEAQSLQLLGQLEAAGGRRAEAKRLILEALSGWAALGDRASAAGCLDNLADLPDAADKLGILRLRGAARALRRSCGLPSEARSEVHPERTTRAEAEAIYPETTSPEGLSLEAVLELVAREL